MIAKTWSLCWLILAALVAVTSAQTLLEPHFTVPDEYANDFGDFRSPLIFNDGSKIESAADWPKRRAEISEQWQQLLGEWPPLITEPKVEILKTEQRENFTQLTVRFLWTPVETTTGYLMIPDGIAEGEKRPAVLTVFYEPETSAGLTDNPLRDFAYQLVKRGFVTLSVGTTETSNAKQYATYFPEIDNATVQPLSMLGCAAANCWHVLAARPEVDSERIGITGHSYGGKWSMFAACLFDKFAAVAVSDPGIVLDSREQPNSSVNYWEPWYLGWHPRPWRKRGIPTDENPAQGLYPRLIKEGRDLHELHALMAPRPFLLSGGHEDPPERWRALNHLVQIQQLLGHENHVGMTTRPNHAPTEESNAVIYAFFEHFLK
jgi:hypothetical protein